MNTAENLLEDSENTNENKRLEKQNAKLMEQIGILSGQKAHLEAVLAGIVSSKSWKLTSPLRRSVELVRMLSPLFRNRKFNFSLRPGRSVIIDGDSVRVNGPSPSVELKSDGFPSGWVEIRGDVRSKRLPVFFLLYYRTAEGYDPTQRVWLPLGYGNRSVTVAQLPTGIQGMRLDPFDPEANFDLPSFQIREIGKVQLAWRMFLQHAGSSLKNPRAVFVKLRKAYQVIREGGFTALRVRLFADNFTQNYQEWVRKYDTLSDDDRKSIKAHVEKFKYRPLVSIVMPVYNTPEKWLRAAIESVQRQLYPNWELCIADDLSPDPTVRRVLEEYARADKRIKIVYRKENGHIAKASNSALELATGEFVALLDHDDELTEHALYMVVNELQENPELDMIYSDEDKITSYGMRFNPHFKSDWNPDLFTSQMYICHLSVYRREVMKRVGNFRDGFDGSQDWDLALRVVDSIPESHIKHIPHVLYHWRVIEGSTAQSTSAKPYVMASQKRAVEEHLKRRGITGADVTILESISHIRVRYPVPNPEPLVSVIIPTKDQRHFLERCVKGILENTRYKNIELIIINNNSTEPETFEFFKSAQKDPRVTVLNDPRPFNYSQLNNFAVAHSKGQLLAFLNNDLEITEPEWLSEMVSYAVQSQVGAVGARLLFPNGLLQHGGVILGIGGVAGHNHKGRPKHDPGYFNRAILPQNLSAVTAACLVMRREVFDKIEGFDEKGLSVAFNDVDLCLRVRRQGLRVVYNPYAELIHHESISRGYETTPEKFARFEREIETMKNRWKATLAEDPYYNPNLTLISEDFSFSFPPRASKPWRE